MENGDFCLVFENGKTAIPLSKVLSAMTSQFQREKSLKGTGSFSRNYIPMWQKGHF